MARRRGNGSGLRGLCRGSDGLLECTRRLACREGHARGGRHPDCRTLPGIRRSVRGALTMQLGMIGLGRMGANMVRRLIRGGHECVVFDMSAAAVAELAKEKA